LPSPSTKQAITSCLHPQQNKQSPLAFTLNKTSNHLLPSPSTKQAITSCLHPQKKGDNDIIMTLEIYVLVWDRYKYVVAINWLIESKPPLLITGSPTAIYIYNQMIKYLHRFAFSQKDHILSQK
jgi:hypothetical protein